MLQFVMLVSIKEQVLRLIILKLSETIEKIKTIMLKLTMRRHFKYVPNLTINRWTDRQF